MCDAADNVTQLAISNKVFHRLQKVTGDYAAASHLISSAAFQVGFVRLAAGMARWSHEPDGLDEMKIRLANEQFDVLMLAPIDFAARTAMTSLDLCAAAAYRLRKSGGREGRGDTDYEADLRSLLWNMKNRDLRLHSHQQVWSETVAEAEELDLLEKARHLVTHRAIPSHSTPGSAPTEIQIGDSLYDGVNLTARFVEFAEIQYESFTQAVLADFPEH